MIVRCAADGNNEVKRAVAAGVSAALVAAGGFVVAAAVSDDDEGSTTAARARPPRATASPTVVSMAGYPLAQDPESAVEFNSALMFEATVTGPPQAPRKIHANAETGAPVLVYLPVPVRVTAVYRGDLTPGDQVFLRDLGGTAADGTTLHYENGWPDDTWKPGTKLFVFSQERVAIAGQEAVTPNMVFVDDNGVARSAADSQVPTMPMQHMRDKVVARWR